MPAAKRALADGAGNPQSTALKGNECKLPEAWANTPRIRGPQQNHAEMNAPDRFELFLLGEGEKKITEAIDTRTPNTSIFTFNKEDHTLANMLRERLVKNPAVEFCGYKIPHPLFAAFELRLQTNGEQSPREMLVAACKSLVRTLDSFSAEWTKEYELRKLVGGGDDK